MDLSSPLLTNLFGAATSQKLTSTKPDKWCYFLFKFLTTSPSFLHPFATNPCPCKSAHISINYYYTRHNRPLFQCLTTNVRRITHIIRRLPSSSDFSGLPHCGMSSMSPFPTGVLFSLQPAGICHPCLLKKVAGFLRSMLCTLQTWNLFGGSADNSLGGSDAGFFPHWVFFSPSSLQESLTPAC